MCWHRLRGGVAQYLWYGLSSSTTLFVALVLSHGRLQERNVGIGADAGSGSHELKMILIPSDPLEEKRADQRFSFFADAEVTLCDGTSVPTQVAELSSRGCYIGTLLPIPVGTEIRLSISDGIRMCELQGRVVYLHSSSGLGIFGMGVQLENMATQQRSVIEAWLRELARKRTPGNFDSAQQG